MLEVDRMSTARLSLAGEVWHLSGVARGGSPSTAPRTVAKRVVDASCQPYMEPQSNRLESYRTLSINDVNITMQPIVVYLIEHVIVGPAVLNDYWFISFHSL